MNKITHINILGKKYFVVKDAFGKCSLNKEVEKTEITQNSTITDEMINKFPLYNRFIDNANLQVSYFNTFLGNFSFLTLKRNYEYDYYSLIFFKTNRFILIETSKIDAFKNFISCHICHYDEDETNNFLEVLAKKFQPN